MNKSNNKIPHMHGHLHGTIQSNLQQLIHELQNEKDPLKRAVLVELINIKKNEINKKEQINKQQLTKQISTNSSKQSTDLLIQIKKEEEDSIKKLDSLLVSNEVDVEVEADELIDSWKDNLEPEYQQYMEYDKTNNRMLERLNSEINFRTQGSEYSKLTKPYGDVPNTVLDSFARI